MACERRYTVEVLERSHTDRFDSCDVEEELELQGENIIPLNNIEDSFLDNEIDIHVNQDNVSSSGLNRPNTSSVSDSAAQVHTTF